MWPLEDAKATLAVHHSELWLMRSTLVLPDRVGLNQHSWPVKFVLRVHSFQQVGQANRAVLLLQQAVEARNQEVEVAIRSVGKETQEVLQVEH